MLSNYYTGSVYTDNKEQNFGKKGGKFTENISRAKKKALRKPLEKELKGYREMGISLYLDGTLSNPKSIAKACQIAEGGGYMRDYVEDERGRIARVDFDFVKDK